MIFPIILFISVWLLQSTLYFFSPYIYKNISFLSWMIIIIANISVITGYLTIYFSEFNKVGKGIYKIDLKKNLNFDKSQLEKYITLISILVFLGISGEIYFMIQEIQKMNQDIFNIYWYRHVFLMYARDQANINIFHSLMNYILMTNIISILLSSIYYAIFNEKKIISFLPLFLSLFFSIITLQRYLFISSFILWVSGTYLISFYLFKNSSNLAKKRAIKALSIFSVFVIGIIILVIGIRINIDTGGSAISIIIESAFRSVYSYLAGNIVALNHFLEREIIIQNGLVILQSIFKWLARFGVIDPSLVASKHMQFVDLGPVKGNVYTYIRLFYEDFGILGMVLFCYCWGALSSILLEKFLKNFTFLKFLISSYIVFAFFISFYTFAFHNLTQFFLLSIFAIYIDFKLKVKIENA